MIDALMVLLLWAGLLSGQLGTNWRIASGVSAMAFLVAVFGVVRGRWQAAPLALLAVLQSASQLVGATGSASLATIGLIGLGDAISSVFLWWWPIPHLAVPTGPHAVGVQVIEFPVPGPADGRALRADGRRWLQLYLWYPAEPVKGSKPRFLQTAREASAFAGTTRALGGLSFLLVHFKLARTHSHDGAAVKTGSFPVVIFNHGGVMWPTQNFGLMEELASYGYIMCSVAHPGDTAGVVWQSGEITPVNAEVIAAMKLGGTALRDQASFLLSQDKVQKRALLKTLAGEFDPILATITRRWTTDSLDAVDYLRSAAAAQNAATIAGSADFSRLAYAGMSLGGSVAHECCFEDSRAKAGINLDGMNWTFNRIDQNIPVPFLQIYGDPFLNIDLLKAKAGGDIQTPHSLTPAICMSNDFYYEAPEVQGERTDVVRVIVRGAGHMAFTDHALSARGPVRKVMGIGQANGRSVAMHVAQLSRTFLDVYLKGESPRAFVAALDAPTALVRQNLSGTPSAAD